MKPQNKDQLWQFAEMYYSMRKNCTKTDMELFIDNFLNKLPIKEIAKELDKDYNEL
jgi:hypothetical protein